MEILERNMLVFIASLTVLLRTENTKGETVLSAFKTQLATCNERTVLQCNISSSMEMNILDVYWKKRAEKDFKCNPKSSNNTPGFECSLTGEFLTLTLLRSTPANMGTYFCCIMTQSTHGSEEINVALEGECAGESSHQMVGPDQMQCVFTGVYPDGTVNWFHYDKNVTSGSTTTSLENPDGTFNISSVLNIQNHLKIYNCSLWVRKHQRYLKLQGLEAAADAASEHRLSWILLLLPLVVSLRTCLSVGSSV